MKLKQYVAHGMTLAIVLSSMTPISAQTKLEGLGKERKELNLEQQISKDKLDVKQNDSLRVIVELEDAPIIEYATKKGISIDEMKASEISKLKSSIKSEQQKVQNKIKSKGIKLNIINEFTNVVNGFAINTTLEDALEIEKLDGVKSVSIANEYQRPEPLMNNSTDIVNAPQTWEELGYDGEGTVVAVIDTGVDANHKDFNLENEDKVELDENEIKDIIKDKSLKGTYRNAKVPYGYNYMDNNQEILDLGPDASMHGMHVAGTVGANGDIDSGGIKGVAPEAQILGMKVFGNNPAMPSTFGDVIIKAIDDSVELGADVINMSLGSTASFVDDEDKEQMAVNRAVDNGVVMSISAGNSDVFGSGWDLPYAENPDIGVVGSPGLATDSIQVASSENNVVTAMALEYKVGDETFKAGYMNSGPDAVETLKGENEYVDCGLGKPEEVKDVAGKIALIQRGEIAFTDKIANAEAAGAIGVIVYNHTTGGDGLISMMYPEGGTIPAVFIGNSHGSRMKGLIESGKNKVEFKGATAEVANPAKGQMSDFTSWGTTPDLEFKPEITAPGGNIWSTAQNDGYQNMSGTSMAAPHVAGGSALVLQRVDEDFKLDGKERAEMAKNLMMSTAKPHVETGHSAVGNLQHVSTPAGDNYTSPRRQGSGVMDLYAATTTPAIVTDKTTGISKVSLKEIKGDKVDFTISVENFSDKEASYKLGGTVQTPLTDGDYDYLQQQNIIDNTTKNFPISFSDNEITVSPKSTKEITVSIDLSNAVTGYGNVKLSDIFANGTFVEGFVTLECTTDTNPDLSIPYMGFYGDWDQAPTLDASIYDTDRYSFYGVTSMTYEDKEGNLNFLGVDAEGKESKLEDIAISPNGDNLADSTVPVLSFLRNVKELEVDILDKDGKVVRSLTKDKELRKHYYDGRYTPYTVSENWEWDGKINNKVAKDGDYIYRIKTKVDFEDAVWQSYEFPVKVDTVKPTIKSVKYDKDAKTLDVEATDNHKVYEYELVEGDKVIATSTDGKFKLTNAVDITKSQVKVYDFARNVSSESLEAKFVEPTGPAEGDKTIPTVMVNTPEFFGVYNTNKVTVSGTVHDTSSISEFKIDGKDVELKFNKTTGKWEFTTDLELENGYNSVNIQAKDSAGNNIEFGHKLFIDTIAPVIENVEVDRSTEGSINIKANISDNSPSMKVKVNGNVVANIDQNWEYYDELEAAKYDLNETIELTDDMDEVIIEVTDNAKNTTKVNISKEAETIDMKQLIGEDRYETSVKISQSGWDKADTVVIVNGDAIVDGVSATPLASLYNAPILLTQSKTIPSVVLNEIERLGAKEVVIIGGDTVVSSDIVNQLKSKNIDVNRIGGKDRYETSLKIAKEINSIKPINRVYVANGFGEADALSIASQAGRDNQPIILTPKDKLTVSTYLWLMGRDITDAYVIGGTDVVSEVVESQLDKLTTHSMDDNRLGGIDRQDTNAKVISKFYNDKNLDGVIVAKSDNLIDALTAGPLAAKTNSPVVIATQKLSEGQRGVLSSKTTKSIYEVGGGIHNEVVDELKNILK